MVQRSTFVNLANKFMDDTFRDFRKPLVVTVFGDSDYLTESTETNHTGFAIAISLDFSKFDSEAVELGDFLLFTNVSQWTIDPTLDTHELTYDGESVQIVNKMDDAADAAYFMQVRRK